MEKTPKFTEITHAERIERWSQCERVLLGLDEHTRLKHWNMENFITTTACGTVGCAAGHCAMDQWFIGQGLAAKPDRDGYWYLPPDVYLDDFFGVRGSSSIFHKLDQRSVETVVEEVREHVRWLGRRAAMTRAAA